MSTALPEDPAEDLVSALEVIEDQPLADRASGYAALHDALVRTLDKSAGERA